MNPEGLRLFAAAYLLLFAATAVCCYCTFCYCYLPIQLYLLYFCLQFAICCIVNAFRKNQTNRTPQLSEDTWYSGFYNATALLILQHNSSAAAAAAAAAAARACKRIRSEVRSSTSFSNDETWHFKANNSDHFERRL
jgi:hypothetical protein